MAHSTAQMSAPPTGSVAATPPFETLVDRHAAELRRFIGRTVRAPADVDDLCQEVLLRAHRGYRRLEGQPDAQPRAWLYRIAANVCVDYLRRGGRHSSVELVETASGAPGPDEVAATREELERVVALLAQLPPRQRTALELRRLGGLDYAEVAHRMGGTEQAARANVYQAVRRLKQGLEEPQSVQEAPR